MCIYMNRSLHLTSGFADPFALLVARRLLMTHDESVSVCVFIKRAYQACLALYRCSVTQAALCAPVFSLWCFWYDLRDGNSTIHHFRLTP